MNRLNIVHYRLVNQQIAETRCKKPQEVVSWLGAMQAQEFAMAKWAIGLRLPETTNAAVEKAFNDGLILRTHVLRPTWHFVCPEDIGWILELSAPRVHAANAYMYRKLELNSAVFKKSNDVLVTTLQGGKQLSRDALRLALERKKILADGMRLAYIMMQAELEGIVCSGARQGKQFTYALLPERAPVHRKLGREEALARLSLRYFTSRGPASIRDFAWWSGLTMQEAKTGAACLPSHVKRKVINGMEYLFVPPAGKITDQSQTSFLLPNYDEYGISYKDRSAIFTAKKITPGIQGKITPYNSMFILNGAIGGIWKSLTTSKTFSVETIPFNKLSKTEHQALKNAVQRYRAFVGKTPEEEKPQKKK